MANPIPTEFQEHRVLAQWLGHLSVLWTSVANERKDVRIAKKLKTIGVSAGVPDILIFTSPPTQPDKKGTAVELKRTKKGRLSDNQKVWLYNLQIEGWAVIVGLGADDTIEKLQKLGYGTDAGNTAGKGGTQE